VVATHTASDIALSAYGRYAGVFCGVMDNTEVFFNVMRVALGDAHLRQEILHRLGL
jgi:alkaline phosphatase